MDKKEGWFSQWRSEWNYLEYFVVFLCLEAKIIRRQLLPTTSKASKVLVSCSYARTLLFPFSLYYYVGFISGENWKENELSHHLVVWLHDAFFWDSVASCGLVFSLIRKAANLFLFVYLNKNCILHGKIFWICMY